MSNNKENVNDVSKRTKAHRKSLGCSKNILNTSETANSSELTSEFAGYLDYVRSLQTENECLKKEKDSLIGLCNEELINIKSTYGGEIDALRKALDEATTVKCSTDYHNEKLLEENNNLKIKFARKIESINELEKKYEEAEANLIKSRKGVDRYENVCEENEDLLRYNVLLNEQLKCEINKRSEAESRLISLSDEIEFLNKINSSNNTLNRENSINMSNKTESYYSEKFDDDIKEMREELNEEFDQYKQQMENTFKTKLDEMNNTNMKLNEKYNKMYNEKKLLQNENDSLNGDIATYESKVAAFNARDIRNAEIISKINKEHDDFIKDILGENQSLKNKLQKLTSEMTDLMNEKIANEKETYIFRSMLKGEQSRVNISDISSPKRRKLDEEENNEITAWSKDSVKIFCDDTYDGSYLELLNHGSNEINLNEWKVDIVTKSGDDILYTFPPRIVNAGGSLKLWSLNKDVMEDDSNILMNIVLPSIDIMSCKLSNDMDEVEASFNLNKNSKRKIIKAITKKSTNQEKCSIM